MLCWMGWRLFELCAVWTFPSGNRFDLFPDQFAYGRMTWKRLTYALFRGTARINLFRNIRCDIKFSYIFYSTKRNWTTYHNCIYYNQTRQTFKMKRRYSQTAYKYKLAKRLKIPHKQPSIYHFHAVHVYIYIWFVAFERTVPRILFVSDDFIFTTLITPSKWSTT